MNKRRREIFITFWSFENLCGWIALEKLYQQLNDWNINFRLKIQGKVASILVYTLEQNEKEKLWTIMQSVASNELAAHIDAKSQKV